MNAVFPRWVWLWLPIIYLVVEIAARLIDTQDRFYPLLFLGESGFVEMMTVILLLPAAYIAVRNGGIFRRRGSYLFFVAMVVYALGCLFLFAEEISYGQHLFKWSSPDYFLENNVQDETNLHNMDFFNKNVLKWVTLIWMFVVGFVLPMMKDAGAYPGVLDNSPISVLLIDGKYGAPAAFIAFVTHLIAKINHSIGYENFHEMGFINLRETTELYISFFMLLYVICVRENIKASGRGGH